MKSSSEKPPRNSFLLVLLCTVFVVNAQDASSKLYPEQFYKLVLDFHPYVQAADVEVAKGELEKQFDLKCKTIISSSDAHYLDMIGEPKIYFDLEELSIVHVLLLEQVFSTTSLKHFHKFYKTLLYIGCVSKNIIIL